MSPDVVTADVIGDVPSFSDSRGGSAQLRAYWPANRRRPDRGGHPAGAQPARKASGIFGGPPIHPSPGVANQPSEPTSATRAGRTGGRT
jgi:hypothetical protein